MFFHHKKRYCGETFNSFEQDLRKLMGGTPKKTKNASRPLAKVTSSDSKNLYINYKNFACFRYNLI